MDGIPLDVEDISPNGFHLQNLPYDSRKAYYSAFLLLSEFYQSSFRKEAGKLAIFS